MTYRVHTEYSIATDSWSMAVIDTHYDRSRAFLQPFVWKTMAAASREEGFCLESTYFNEGHDVKAFLQAMLDAAWKLGLRPTGAPDQADELKAVRYHLEDMRKLAFPTPPTQGSETI